MSKKFRDVSTVGGLKEYLEEKGKNHRCYYHYTSWDNFVKIYEGKSFLLTRGNSPSVNDQHEARMKGAKEEWDKTYIGSFSYGYAENMAMWGLYGLPVEEAVRIAIPRKAMNDWIGAIKEVIPFKNDKVSPVLRKFFQIHLSDMVYANVRSDSTKLQLTHDDYTIWATPKNGLQEVDKNPSMTGFIKNYAWKYENEVRLHIHLDQSIGCDRVMVKIPLAVLNEIKITTGPAFECKDNATYKKLDEEGKIEASSFENLVHYRSLCDLCQHGSFERKNMTAR